MKDRSPGDFCRGWDVRFLTWLGDRPFTEWMVAVALLLTPPFSHAASAPTLEHFYPVGWGVGQTGVVQSIGTSDPWPPKVWCSDPTVRLTPETNAGRWRLEIPAGASLGPRAVRFYNEQGASGVRALRVESHPAIPEVEPNDDPAKGQVIPKLPAWVNGRLDKNGDMDSFAFDLAEGQTLVASVEAYVFGSPVDAAIRLVDPRGVQVTWNHDDGITLDPKLIWKAERSGRYILQVFGFPYPANSDVRFGGGNSSIYQLHLHAGPYLNHTLPLGVQRVVDSSLKGVAFNVGGESSNRTIQVHATDFHSGVDVVRVGPPEYENEVEVPVSEGKEWMEQEPNDTSGTAMKLEIPSAVTGRIATAKDVDRFQFQAVKGERYEFRVDAARLGFAWDPWLRLEKPDGKEIQRSDDDASSDPSLAWTATEDGSFVLALGSLLHRVPENAYYHLNLKKGVPALRLTVGADVFVLKVGETNSIAVTARRSHGFHTPVRIHAEGLPPGVTCPEVELGEKVGEVTLKLTAGPAATSFSGPWQLQWVDGKGTKGSVVRELITLGVDNGVPNGFSRLLVPEVADLWLTVTVPPPAAPKAEKK